MKGKRIWETKMQKDEQVIRIKSERMQNVMLCKEENVLDSKMVKLMYILILSVGTLSWMPMFVNTYTLGSMDKFCGSFMFFGQ